MTEPDALIINLKRSKERWAASSSALQRHGLVVERIEALDARTEACRKRYHSGHNARSYFAPLKEVEIACFRSHRRAWRRVIELDRPMLVCEDDIAVDAGLPGILSALAGRFGGESVAVKLYGKRPPVGAPQPLGGSGASLVKARIVPLGCVAVWLTPEGARDLLAGSEHFHQPVDVYAQQTWTHGVDTYCVSPFPVREVSEHLGGSTLAVARAPIATRLTREIRRPLFRARLRARALWETR